MAMGHTVTGYLVDILYLKQALQKLMPVLGEMLLVVQQNFTRVLVPTPKLFSLLRKNRLW